MDLADKPRDDGKNAEWHGSQNESELREVQSSIFDLDKAQFE